MAPQFDGGCFIVYALVSGTYQICGAMWTPGVVNQNNTEYFLMKTGYSYPLNLATYRFNRQVGVTHTTTAQFKTWATDQNGPVKLVNPTEFKAAVSWASPW